MNAKKLKKLRKLARQIVQTEVERNGPTDLSAQVMTRNGTVLNTAGTVRGMYQYLKDPQNFLKRFDDKLK
jgi:hypothetical protein